MTATPPLPPGHRPPAQPGGHRPAEYVHYEVPRRYDTSSRPAGAITRARWAEAQIQRPQDAPAESAWATQTRRIQNVAEQRTPMPLGTVLGWILSGVLALLLVVVLGFFFLMYVLGGYGAGAWVVQFLLALASLLVIAGLIALADRWDPQPVPLLLSAVLWGAAVAAAMSYVINTMVSILAYSATGSEDSANFVGAVISAPLTEETTKGLGLVVLFFLARRYFNGPLDGLLYGALIGGGFAFTENILYYGQFWEGGAAATAFGVLIRGVIGIFGHAVYTSLTGVVMGLVVRRFGTVAGALVFLVATWPGIALHALWNFSSIMVAGSLGGLALILGLEIVMSALWLVLIAVLVLDEARLTRVRLGDYANAGWLTHDEVSMLATWRGRREGKAWARTIGMQSEMKKMIRDAAELASVRQRLLADGAHPRTSAVERLLLDRLMAHRRVLMGALR
ncbi:PrsW family intramembrane metalloprotease [Brachybacterium sp. JHP9]|uniref:PrsW family intramembrane metalloprotease n=1 Tax=Brachybacterium equifaecis TaxID=2910770 RepID=A0ABT0QW53_9MICO|nr:PrsW family intramembrane metalloprotease [Brachybacterium equifaecis]MCL6421866.1 PrsW family intramembrane metalloprotease [Brachybacterium equifaecis]